MAIVWFMSVHCVQPFTVAGRVHSYEETMAGCTYNRLSALPSFDRSDAEGDGGVAKARSEK